MTITQAVILGIVEGITEFLPISSTAHLILTARLLGLAQTDFVTLFEIVIQASAVCAVIVGYFDIVKKNMRLLFLLFISFIPTGLVGFALHSVIKKTFFESDMLIIGSILTVGILFIIIENMIIKKIIILSKEVKNITIADAVIIGLFQA